MKHKIGVFLMFLGMLSILAALGLVIMNRQEDRQAGISSGEVLAVLQEEILQVKTSVPTELNILDNTPEEFLTEEDLVMTEKVIKGHAYIGYLCIPELQLQLPVMSQWNNQKLQIAPCRYTGTLRGKDLVIMAHSFASHFGSLKNLSEGTQIQFTDMDGNLWNYEVAAMDILDATDVEEMVAGEYDMTLFTCTTDRVHRVTVRCNLTEQ